MAVKTIGTMTLDELIASGKHPLDTRVVTIKGSGTLKRGQLIGTDGADNGAFEEGNTPVGILCSDVKVTTGGVSAMIYVSGHFNANKVIGFVASADAELRALGVFVEAALTY